MKKSYRYNGKTGIGVHSEFLKTRLVGVDSWRGGKMILPKPQNAAELTLLAKFIFGVELTVRFEYFDDYFGKIDLEKNIKLSRYLKMLRLENKEKDYIPADLVPRFSSNDGKMILISLRYFCNQKHNDYYDGRFNHVVFDSCYELDSYFWKHCIGEIYCGGIGGSSYGQVRVTSLKEYERLMKFKTTNGVRSGFRRKIERLIELDKAYDV